MFTSFIHRWRKIKNIHVHCAWKLRGMIDMHADKFHTYQYLWTNKRKKPPKQLTITSNVKSELSIVQLLTTKIVLFWQKHETLPGSSVFYLVSRAFVAIVQRKPAQVAAQRMEAGLRRGYQWSGGYPTEVSVLGRLLWKPTQKKLTSWERGGLQTVRGVDRGPGAHFSKDAVSLSEFSLFRLHKHAKYRRHTNPNGGYDQSWLQQFLLFFKTRFDFQTSRSCMFLCRSMQ